MSELKQFDDTIHDEDEYETPRKLYYSLCEKYHIHPWLDVASTYENSKCTYNYTKETDGLSQIWVHDVWCNPPHSKTEEFVRKAQQQWEERNINIMMIVPANAICAHFFDDIFEDPEYGGVACAEYYRISGRTTFLQNGKPTKYPSRNSYFVVIWRKSA